MTIADRRRIARFTLQTPAFIRGETEERPTHPGFLLTRDVSSGGAYFQTLQPDVYEGHVKVELLLQVPAMDNQSRYARLTTSGEVLWHDRSGFAVRFDDDYQLKPYS